MKTKQEIEQLKDYVESKINNYRLQAEDALFGGNHDKFEIFDREYAKAVAQYNILLEVLK